MQISKFEDRPNFLIKRNEKRRALEHRIKNESLKLVVLLH